MDVEEDDVYWLHPQHVLAQIQALRSQFEQEDEPWLLVTYGLGLARLGQRLVEFDPRNPEAIPSKVADLWWDHVAYGTLQLHLVQPTPVLRIRRPYIACIVVVIMPGIDRVNHAAVLMREFATDSSAVHPSPYALWVPTQASPKEILHLVSFVMPAFAKAFVTMK